MTPPEDKIIEIKGRTVLKLGGYLITIEPEVVEEKKFRTVTPADAGGRSDIAKQLAAEADLVQKTRIPFDGSQIRRPPRIGTAPVPGDKFTVGTTERVISRIASHHGGLWAVVDSAGVPALLRGEGSLFVLVPPSGKIPLVGDVVFTPEGNFPIMKVLGEAETGGWAVRTTRDINIPNRASLVLHLDEERWAFLSAVEI